MNKKGFVLVETLVVVIFVLLIFTILYNSAVPLLGRYVELSYYNDLDTTYDLYYLKNMVKNDNNYSTIENSTNGYKILRCNNNTLDNINECDKIFLALEISNDDKLIYIDINNYNKTNFSNDSEITNEIKDYLKYIEENSKILLLEHNGYISYIELNKKSSIDKIKENIKSNNPDSSCQNATLSWTDPDDGTIYISGSADCVDFNYVWYSGKLWRITALYLDGSMKLVTENAITAIFWGSDVEYDGSYMYQWLNEDFKDTLVSSNTVLKNNAIWNYSTDDNSTPVRPETIAPQKTKTATVGLLNAYEYYNAYRCNGSSACTGSTYNTGYLKIDVNWWLITPRSASNVRLVSVVGTLYDYSPLSNTHGARPSIILQSNIHLNGSGTKTEPYRLVGVDESANVGDYLYSRYSGEYVNFNGEKYRIVSKDENNITKLTKFDYIKTGTTVEIKNFASTVYFGESENTKTDTFWDYYLNNNSEGGWLYSIPATYKNMMVDGTYYLGSYGSSNVNYKATICKDSAASLNSTTINNCTKYTSNDANSTFTGKVGLPRVGEMFSAQLKVGTNSYSIMWLITPYDGSKIRGVDANGSLNYYSPSSFNRGARPSITLSSSVKIACNSTICDGTEEHPYDLSM